MKLCLFPRVPTAFILALNLAASPTFLTAQQSAADVPAFTIRANTRLVVVDVVVTDKKGQPVPGLKPEDFTVEENGKKQKVSLFIPPAVANPSVPQALPPGIFSNHPEHLAPSGPLTVLVLDATNSLFQQQAYARSQMLNYVLAHEQSGRTMGVIALTDRLHVLQQFTSDPKVLATAIRNFRPQEPTLQPGVPAAGSAVPVDMGGPGGQVALAIMAAHSELASFSNLQIAQDIERRTLITIEAMNSLARMLGGLPGRKNVVWLTGTLPFDLIPEDRTMSNAELLADLPGQGSQRSAALNGVGSQAATQRGLYGQEIKEAESRLASANIAIYPVDLHGLVGGSEGLASRSFAHNNDIHGAGMANSAGALADSLQPSQGTMREVADQTGGKAYINENEIQEGVELAVADNKASYGIGYYTDNKKLDGKFRKLKVKVDNHDVDVRYRKGYFAVDPTSDKKWKPEQEVAQAVQFNGPATQVLFMAQVKTTDPGKMRVVFKVDARSLTAEDSGSNKKMNVSLYVNVFEANGQMTTSHRTDVNRDFDAATYQQIVDHGMLVPVDMEFPIGSKELRLAVLDNKTGFIGTANGPFGQ